MTPTALERLLLTAVIAIATVLVAVWIGTAIAGLFADATAGLTDALNPG